MPDSESEYKAAGGWIIKKANEQPQWVVENVDGRFLISNQCNFIHRAFPTAVEAAIGVIEVISREADRLRVTLEEIHQLSVKK